MWHINCNTGALVYCLIYSKSSQGAVYPRYALTRQCTYSCVTTITFACVCILTTLNIYGSVLSIKPYDIVNFTHEDITITCISYCDSRNISFSWIRWSITEPCNVYWRCPINNITINYDIKSTMNIYRCSYFNSLVASCDKRWSWYKWSFINIWCI